MKIVRFDTAKSTNNEAKLLAQAGEAEWTIVLAEAQSAGKGSRGRSFFSPEGTGLYMSILLRPALSAENSLYITTAAAVAVARVLQRNFQVDAKIKWVNDLYIGDRKICGILTESALKPDGYLEWAILGIGINLCPASDIPKEIENIIGFVCNEPKDIDKLALCKEIAEEFKKLYASLGTASFASEYNERLMLKGKKIRVISADSSRPAVVLGTDERLRLLVEYEDGTHDALYAGEVSISLE